MGGDEVEVRVLGEDRWSQALPLVHEEILDPVHGVISLRTKPKVDAEEEEFGLAKDGNRTGGCSLLVWHVAILTVNRRELEEGRMLATSCRGSRQSSLLPVSK